MGFNFTQSRLTFSTVRYVLAPLVISAQHCYVFYILMSDDITECILFSYELMEINFVDANIYSSFVH